jgi:hypothetical protein
MKRGRSIPTWAIIGVSFTCGLLGFATWAFAQAGIHKNSFETKLGWSKGGSDAAHDEAEHKLDGTEPHNGQMSEYIALNVKTVDPKQHIYYTYPIGNAPLTEDLRVSLWLRANRPGIKLMARVVLPNERDPNNLDFRLTTYIQGDDYQLAGRWQPLNIRKPVEKWKMQQHILSKGTNRALDYSGAYIDALVVNLNAGPGATKIWIDDLEVGPLASSTTPFKPAVRPDNSTPAKTTSAPRAVNRANVEFVSNRLMVSKKPMFFRAIRYSDTMLPVLGNAGFNTVFFGRNANPTLLSEAAELDLWLVPEFRITNDEGIALPADEITKQVRQHADNNNVIFQSIEGMVSNQQVGLVSAAMQHARRADPAHAISGNVWDGLMPYSRNLNLVGVHRFPLMTTLELPKYREFLESRRKLATPGAFTWTWIQTHLPESHSELLYNQPAQAAFREPVGPQPEQIRLLAYTAISSGCRGLGFWSDRFLADSHQGRDRLLSCALLNQEIDMLEPLLVTIEEAPVWIDTSVPDVKAAVLRCSQGVVVIPVWQGRFSQFVPGQAAAAQLKITVPQVPITMQAWEVSPGDVRGLRAERVDRGLRITLPEFGLTSVVVFTSDTNLVGRFQDQARAKRQQAAQWSYEMAKVELEKVIQVEAQLVQAGSTINEANTLIEDAKFRVQKSKELWDNSNFGEAYHEAQRALRPVRILMRAQWEKAVRGLDSPVSSPYAVSYYTLPKHWPFMDQVRRSTVGANLLPGGDFETVHERMQESWKLGRPSMDDVEMIADRVGEVKGSKPEGPVEGKQCAMLQIKPREGKATPAALESTYLTLTSPSVKLPPGTFVQVSGWVNIPTPLTASPDGALLFDSAGGEPMSIRLSNPTPWKKFTVYRRVPTSGTMNVTLALTGIGTVYFDDIRIEPLIAPNGGMVDNNGAR